MAHIDRIITVQVQNHPTRNGDVARVEDGWRNPRPTPQRTEESVVLSAQAIRQEHCSWSTRRRARLAKSRGRFLRVPSSASCATSRRAVHPDERERGERAPRPRSPLRRRDRAHLPRQLAEHYHRRSRDPRVDRGTSASCGQYTEHDRCGFPRARRRDRHRRRHRRREHRALHRGQEEQVRGGGRDPRHRPPSWRRPSRSAAVFFAGRERHRRPVPEELVLTISPFWCRCSSASPCSAGARWFEARQPTASATTKSLLERMVDRFYQPIETVYMIALRSRQPVGGRGARLRDTRSPCPAFQMALLGLHAANTSPSSDVNMRAPGRHEPRRDSSQGGSAWRDIRAVLEGVDHTLVTIGNDATVTRNLANIFVHLVDPRLRDDADQALMDRIPARSSRTAQAPASSAAPDRADPRGGQPRQGATEHTPVAPTSTQPGRIPADPGLLSGPPGRPMWTCPVRQPGGARLVDPLRGQATSAERQTQPTLELPVGAASRCHLRGGGTTTTSIGRARQSTVRTSGISAMTVVFSTGKAGVFHVGRQAVRTTVARRRSTVPRGNVRWHHHGQRRAGHRPE